jgi:hypothetical protein
MRTPILFISLLLTLLAALPARAQPFTYQGHLTDGAGPVSGPVDLRFRLYRSATGTQQVGTQVLAPTTQVDEGTFTTTLDFGSVLSSEEERWIEIDVRQSGQSYTTLSPRQRITAAPVAHKLTGLQFTPAGLVAADQIQDTLSIVHRNVQFGEHWQSFTPSVSGALDRIELIVSEARTAPLTVTLHAGVGLDGPVLGTATVTPSPTGTRSAQFGNVSLFAGNPYTMRFSCPAIFVLEDLHRVTAVEREAIAELCAANQGETDVRAFGEKVRAAAHPWTGFTDLFYLHPTDQSYAEMCERRLGRCEDITNMVSFGMRSVAAMCASDYTPWWAASDNNHAWEVVLDANGENINA